MIKNKDAMFTIGQFAALHDINKKTLMWYDEVGLLKPAWVSEENGYRYYTYHQSSTLETILMLRELNVSIGDIQAFMKTRSPIALKSLLEVKINELDQTMIHLKAVRKLLSNHRQDMCHLLHMDFNRIELIQKEKRYLAAVKITKDTSFEKQVELVIGETKKYQLRRLHDASYGSMISVENLRLGNFKDYSFLFIEMPNPLQKKGLHVQPKGTYLQTFYQGRWDGLPCRYKEILDYAKAQQWKCSGFAYEKGINEIVIDQEEDYITQIEIPVAIE